MFSAALGSLSAILLASELMNNETLQGNSQVELVVRGRFNWSLCVLPQVSEDHQGCRTIFSLGSCWEGFEANFGEVIRAGVSEGLTLPKWRQSDTLLSSSDERFPSSGAPHICPWRKNDRAFRRGSECARSFALRGLLRQSGIWRVEGSGVAVSGISDDYTFMSKSAMPMFHIMVAAKRFPLTGTPLR